VAALCGRGRTGAGILACCWNLSEED
jgi:hypothetical protein